MNRLVDLLMAGAIRAFINAYRLGQAAGSMYARGVARLMDIFPLADDRTIQRVAEIGNQAARMATILNRPGTTLGYRPINGPLADIADIQRRGGIRGRSMLRSDVVATIDVTDARGGVTTQRVRMTVFSDPQSSREDIETAVLEELERRVNVGDKIGTPPVPVGATSMDLINVLYLSVHREIPLI